MKKLITILLAVMMVVTMLPVTAEASNPYQDYDKNYASNKKLVDNERTDEYALDFFSYSSTEDWAAKYPEQYKVMKEVTKGIKGDYEKVKALAEWVNKNMTYDTKNDADGSLAAAGIPEWMRGACGDYADTFTVLARLAGFPAKSIFGVFNVLGGQYHAWNHVFVDGR